MMSTCAPTARGELKDHIQSAAVEPAQFSADHLNDLQAKMEEMKRRAGTADWRIIPFF